MDRRGRPVLYKAHIHIYTYIEEDVGSHSLNFPYFVLPLAKILTPVLTITVHYCFSISFSKHRKRL